MIFSADALRNAAFPLIVIVGATLFGGSLDTGALLRAAIYGGVGLAIAVTVGVVRYQSTRYYIGPEAIHYVTGVLSKKVTDVRLDRIQAIDVHQGPLQRAFGVFSVDIQTGAGRRAARSRCRPWSRTRSRSCARRARRRPPPSRPATSPRGRRGGWPGATWRSRR